VAQQSNTTSVVASITDDAGSASSMAPVVTHPRRMRS
jgi:hypothetical protein